MILKILQRKYEYYKNNKRKKRIEEIKEACLKALKEYEHINCTICEASWEDIK